jgi:hypothetical protein
MSNNIQNNIMNSLTKIDQSTNNENKNNEINKTQDNNNVLLYLVDVKKIIESAKNDKRFYKLLNLCIKYDVHLFNQYNESSSLLQIEQLLIQTNKKQSEMAKELSEKIMNISINGPVDSGLIDIEIINSEYKKKFKDVEIIVYMLKNIYDDDSLKTMCCVETKKETTTNSSPYLSSSVNTNILTVNTLNTTSKSKSSVNEKKNMKEKNSKYIAVYSN